MKRQIKFLTLAILWGILGTDVLADDFKSVVPPPELGETLTSFRTREQLIEDAINSNQERSNPKIKVYKKDANGNVDYDNAQILEENSSNLGNAEIENFNNATQIRKIVSNNRAQEKLELSYIVGENKQISVFKGQQYAITILDGDNVEWPIDKVELSNGIFEVAMSGNTLILSPSYKANVNGLANLRIYLKGNGVSDSDEVIRFVLAFKNVSKNKDVIASLHIGRQSPFNNNANYSGYTNMTKSAKSRNSRRDIGSNTNNIITSVNVGSNTNKPSNNNQVLLNASNNESKFAINNVTRDRGIGFDFYKNIGISVLNTKVFAPQKYEELSLNFEEAFKKVQNEDGIQ